MNNTDTPQENKKIEIPQDMVYICKELAKVARDKGLHSFSGTFTPDYTNGWRGDISFKWEQGRHGEDSNEIKISSSAWVFTNLTDVKLNS